jgi:hypothetical protein
MKIIHWGTLFHMSWTKGFDYFAFFVVDLFQYSEPMLIFVPTAFLIQLKTRWISVFKQEVFTYLPFLFLPLFIPLREKCAWRSQRFFGRSTKSLSSCWKSIRGICSRASWRKCE